MVFLNSKSPDYKIIYTYFAKSSGMKNFHCRFFLQTEFSLEQRFMRSYHPIMETSIDCIPCFIRHALYAARAVTDDQSVHERVVKQVLARLNDLDMTAPPPLMGRTVHLLIQRETGNPDPYLQIKRETTKYALEFLPALEARVQRAEDPFTSALKLAIAGNIIDLGARERFSETEVMQTVENALATELDSELLARFREEIENARTILYLGDNAGEIVFDRMLISRLPREKVTLAVRNAPIINDATLEDAAASGLTDLVEVISNGYDAPGTVLERCSEDFRRRFREADVVISKGQGNYETLSHGPREVYFLLQAKCPVIAKMRGCEIGTALFFTDGGK